MRDIHRHSWVWAVLPPDCGPVLVLGDPELATVLRHSGVDVILADDERACDVLLVGSSVGPDLAENHCVTRSEVQLIAVDLRPDLRVDASSRLGLFTNLALSPLFERRCRRVAARTAERLRELGYSPRTLVTGNSVAPWSLDRRSTYWRDLTDRPAGAIVVGRKGIGDPNPTGPRSTKVSGSTVLSGALERASIAIGGPLRRRRMQALESGKILLELESGGEEFVLRLGAGPSGRLIQASLRSLDALAAASPPTRLHDLVVWPIAHGPIGPAHYVIERRVAGHHPRRLTDRQIDDCMEFIRLLHTTGQDGRTGSDPGFVDRVEAWERRMASHLEPAAVSLLSGITDRILDSVRDVSTGFGHGDLWPANLLIDDDELKAVLDWDWAARQSLPMLDAMELWAMTTGSSSAVEPGPRALDLLLPFARDGFDERLREHARHVGFHGDRATNVTLTAAYWLERTYRDLRPFSPRPRSRRWFEENVLRPIHIFDRELTKC